MNVVTTIAVLLAVVAVALVAVCEHSEVCRLRYRVLEVERRRDSLERQLREIDADIAATLTPRYLLEEWDRECDVCDPSDPFPNFMPTIDPHDKAPRDFAPQGRHVFRVLGDEGGDR